MPGFTPGIFIGANGCLEKKMAGTMPGHSTSICLDAA
jgi:hypothetical protein